MSVLMKGMEKPKDSGECQFCHTENFITYCCPTGRDDIFYDAIPEWCPLEEPKTGEWVFDTQIPIGKGAYSAGYRCSICGRDYFHVDGMNFCGNCGADMRGEKDEQE